jgi:cell division transport system permease protein
MIPSPYAFTLALQSMIREKWINILSILSIASGLIIIGLALFTVYNVDVATKNLPEKFSMIIYLDNDIQKDKVDAAVGSLRKKSSVLSVRYIPKEEAMKEMKAVLKNSSYVFDGLDENPLPDTLEVKLKKDTVEQGTVKKLADEALKIKGVKEVDYAEKFLSTLNHLKVGLKTIGIMLIVILSTGVVFVCYSTVKILFYRRKDEIETFKLLGATRGFIRTPFLIEGAVIGTAGGTLSLIGIFAFHYLVLLRLSVAMPIFKMILFPSDLFLPLPFVGMFLGTAGAVIALGRLKY